MSPSAILPTPPADTPPLLSTPPPPTLLSSPSSPPDNLPTLDASLLTHHLTTSPRQPPLPNSPDANSGSTCTDHMITAAWSLSRGWEAPQLVPYGPLSLMPTASVLHYATTCFEGLKAYRGDDGRLRLFRPALNCARFQKSAQRIALPAPPPGEVEALIHALLRVDAPKWLPRTQPNGTLYLRPTLLATHPALGVAPPHTALLLILASFLPNLSLPPHLPPKAAGLRLLASTPGMGVRAWPGGWGAAKVGANYGPSLVAQGEARERGFQQVLWLFNPAPTPGAGGEGEGDGEGGWITEAGASNFFAVFADPPERGGGLELVTAPLDDGIILDGVTRRSILDLVRARLPHVRVSERWVGMAEFVAAWERGRVREAFVCGTAYFVVPVVDVSYKGRDLAVPAPGVEKGGVAGRVRGWLGDLMAGREEFGGWGVVVEEDEVEVMAGEEKRMLGEDVEV